MTLKFLLARNVWFPQSNKYNMVHGTSFNDYLEDIVQIVEYLIRCPCGINGGPGISQVYTMVNIWLYWWLLLETYFFMFDSCRWIDDRLGTFQILSIVICPFHCCLSLFNHISPFMNIVILSIRSQMRKKGLTQPSLVLFTLSDEVLLLNSAMLCCTEICLQYKPRECHVFIINQSTC